MPTITKAAPAASKTRAPRLTPGTVQITATQLAAALKRCKPVASTRSAIDAIGGVLLAHDGKQLTMTATDMTLAVQYPMPCKGAKGFVALVSASLLADALAALGQGSYELSLVKGKREEMRVTNGRKTMGLPLLRLEDHPPASFVPSKTVVFNADAVEAARLLKPVLVFASTDETRPILTGVVLDLERRTVWSTDSYRLAVWDAPKAIPARRKGSVNVPGYALTKVLAGTPSGLRITQKAKEVVIERDDCTYTVRIIDGQVPNYTALLPDEYDQKVKVDSVELLDAAKFAAKVIVKNCPVHIAFDKDSLRAHGAAHGGPSMDTSMAAAGFVKKKGGDAVIELGINPAYLADAARVLEPTKDGRVTIGVISPLRPITVTGPGCMALLMPIRLNV